MAKYRIEPKPEGRKRFAAYLETDNLDDVRAWIANPPIKTSTRMYGSDGTYWHLTAAATRREIVVSVYASDTSGMDDSDSIPMRWMPCDDVEVVASRATDEGKKQIARWEGK